MPWKISVFEEKSFWQVYLKARKFTGSKFDKIVCSVVFVILALLLLDDKLLFKLSVFSVPQLGFWIQDWASLGVAFTTSILGFLVAGFSIFATMSKNKIFVILAQIKYENMDGKTDISNFKFIFFNFLIVFIHYITFLFFCLLVKLFLSSKGILINSFSGFISYDVDVAKILLSICAIIFGTWFVGIVLMLKTFMWNLYQAVLISITVEAEIEERKERSKKRLLAEEKYQNENSGKNRRYIRKRNMRMGR